MRHHRSIKVYDTAWRDIINNANIPAVKAEIIQEAEIKENTNMKETKKCPKCGKTLPISEFGLNKAKKDGHQDYCKKCSCQNAKASYARKHNKPIPEIEEPVEMVYVAPVIDKDLKNYTDTELCNELRGRGMNVLINPKPRDLILALKNAGYVGTLEYFEKRSVNLSTFV